MKTTRKHMFTVTVISMVVLASSMAVADPLPGRDIPKFEQKPMLGTPVDGAIYFGHDEWSTLYEAAPGTQDYSGVAMADDFADEFDTPVVHVKWWGSYIGNIVNLGVRQFLIAFETDVPADPLDPTSFSHPGTPILSQVVTLGPLAPLSGTFTEKFVPTGSPEDIYEYNAELKLPFNQDPDTIYWLKIAALVDDPDIEWGWHNRDYTIMNTLASPVPVPGEYIQGTTLGGTDVWHFQDDSVLAQTALSFNTADGIWNLNQSGYTPQHYVDSVDGPGPDAIGVGGIGQYSKDLAFELYTIPEPATLGVLFLGGLLGLFRKRLRQ